MPLDVSEYTAGAATQVLAEPCIIEQQLVIGGAEAVVSNPFGEHTRLIRVHCDMPCRIAIGKTPIAGPTNKRLAANQTEVFGVQPGHRLAVTGTV
ncbi:MAG TPA: hypothetical protein VIJ35_19215 [Bradyrhizobium sp.]